VSVVTPHRVIARLRYLRRIVSAYMGSQPSQLTFWHEPLEMNDRAFAEPCGEYYQGFFQKASYDAHVDAAGIPLLDYRGHVGRQYNPIAIAQWGLGNFNLYRRTGQLARRERYLRAADWLVSNLKPNDNGVPVWQHAFDWEYRDLLKAGWYSALSQGQGVSLLCRAHRDTGRDVYFEGAQAAFRSLMLEVKDGGVKLEEGPDGAWLEESIVDPPTHILNGFLWALWGVHDYAVLSGDREARGLLEACARTVRRNVASFDCGFWSLYEHSGTRLPMLASPFYHGLHISQLSITARLLDMPELTRWAEQWQEYGRSALCRRRALMQKAAFKLLYY
jgi:heparosan-N-sulfate-glucuronate 5-epimerase